MFVDPSDRGKDETIWAVAKHLNGTVYVTKVVGTQGGYGEEILARIASDAKAQDVNLILVEENFGQGMFEKLLLPYLAKVGHQCAVEGIRSNRQKELRICDTLEPIMNQHRLVVAEDVAVEDNESVQGYAPEEMAGYRLFYQMTRITREKGSLGHDDRLDAVAGAVGYWVDVMAKDAAQTAEKAKDKLMEQELKWHFANQLNAFRGRSERRRRPRDGFSTSFGN